MNQSVIENAKLFYACALATESEKGLLDAPEYGMGWHDDTTDDDVVVGVGIVVGSLGSVESETIIALSDRIHFGNSRRVNVAHYCGFAQHKVHGWPPSRSFDLAPLSYQCPKRYIHANHDFVTNGVSTAPAHQVSQ